jgi:hypothetical protein
MPDPTGITLERGFLSQPNSTNRMTSSGIDMRSSYSSSFHLRMEEVSTLVLSGFTRDN